MNLSLQLPEITNLNFIINRNQYTKIYQSAINQQKKINLTYRVLVSVEQKT